MRSRTVRRSAAAGCIYVSAVLGFVGQVLAARGLGKVEYGLFAIVLASTGFLQAFLDLTVEEAVIKYGFRYLVAEEWGKLRRLFRRAFDFKLLGGVITAVALIAAAPFADSIFGHSGLQTPLMLASIVPLAQSTEGIAGNALLLRDRYDIRAFFLVVNMGLRFAALAVGSRYSVTVTVALVALAQVLASTAVGIAGWRAFRHFPRAPAASLGGDRPEIISFMKQSTIASTITTVQSAIAPLLLGVVTSPAQVGLFRVAMAPQQALAAISSPVRLILLTEQTRDWERGDLHLVFAGVKRYTLAATVLMAVAVPPLYVFMPQLVKLVYGSKFADSADGARFILLAAALVFMIGWSKSLPVSIGRPGLRILTHGVQGVVIIPLTLALGARWGATGAAAAVTLSTAAFVVTWAVLIVRINRDRHAAAQAAVAPVAAAEEAHEGS